MTSTCHLLAAGLRTSRVPAVRRHLHKPISASAATYCFRFLASFIFVLCRRIWKVAHEPSRNFSDPGERRTTVAGKRLHDGDTERYKNFQNNDAKSIYPHIHRIPEISCSTQTSTNSEDDQPKIFRCVPCLLEIHLFLLAERSSTRLCPSARAILATSPLKRIK